MTDKTEKDLIELDRLLDQAARDDTVVPQTLMARVLDDADTVQPVSVPMRTVRQSGFLARLSQSLGGWAGIGGLAAASCVGFWIGVSPPEALPDAGGFLLGVETGSFGEAAELTAFGWDIEEG